MKKTIAPLTVIALLAARRPAGAADAVTYKGKTSSGHPVTFKVKNGRIHDLTAGVRMSCIPIQGGGRALGGSELFGFRGSRRRQAPRQLHLHGKPAFHFREVTTNYDLSLKRRGSAPITGRMRLQYSFLVSKYPIGTFSIYSCLGGATFKAKAR